MISLEDREKAMRYYQDKLLNLTEFFTGLASANRSQWFNSVGHAVQGLLAGEFLETLRNDYEKYRKAGKIKEDFRSSHLNKACFTELLRFLEQEIPDQERFDLLKKIYIVTATEDKTKRMSPLPLQFMQIARALTPGEILVLFAAFRIGGRDVRDQDEYISLLTQESGLQYSELTYLNFENLFVKNLLKKHSGSRSVPLVIRDYLITPLGKAFCDYVSHYDELDTIRE